MRTQFLRFLIEIAVPFLNQFRKKPTWYYSLDELRALPSNTIGNDLAYFLDSQNLDLLPKYEVHDLLHVLLEYGTSPKEEMKLQGFMVGNSSASFAGKVLFITGLVIKPEYCSDILKAFNRGRQANTICKYNFSNLVNQNTLQLREEVNIPA